MTAMFVDDRALDFVSYQIGCYLGLVGVENLKKWAKHDFKATCKTGLDSDKAICKTGLDSDKQCNNTFTVSRANLPCRAAVRRIKGDNCTRAVWRRERMRFNFAKINPLLKVSFIATGKI